MNQQIKPWWIAAVLTLFAGLVHADIYQWQDAAGRIHYSDEAPDEYESKKVTPNTERLGVRLSKPADAEAWSEQALSAERPPSSQSQTRRLGSAAKDPAEVDWCEGVVGDCFTEQQDYVCKLRYGLPCKKIYHWKVCLQQDCEDKKLADKCDSPYQLLDRRPAVLTRDQMGRVLALEEWVGERDWQCLSRHGFFCDEVAFEASCQARFGESCDALQHWAEAAQVRCEKQRGSDCNDIDSWKQFRPQSFEEKEKAGIRLAGGGVSARDRLFESLNVERDDPATYPALQAAMESLTGLNIREDRRRRLDCDADWRSYGSGAAHY